MEVSHKKESKTLILYNLGTKGNVRAKEGLSHDKVHPMPLQMRACHMDLLGVIFIYQLFSSFLKKHFWGFDINLRMKREMPHHLRHISPFSTSTLVMGRPLFRPRVTIL